MFSSVTYRCEGRDGSWGSSACWNLASKFDIWKATIRCERTCENEDRRALGMTWHTDCICAVFPVRINRVKHRNQLERNLGICCRMLSCHAGKEKGNVPILIHMCLCNSTERTTHLWNMEKSCKNSSWTHNLMETKKMFEIVYSVSRMAS
jgi:hypothetical protein